MRLIHIILITLMLTGIVLTEDKEHQKKAVFFPCTISETLVDIGNIGAHITNYGYFGSLNLNQSYERPVGSANYHLYYGTLVFGTQVNGETIVIAGDSQYPSEWGVYIYPDTVEIRTGEEAVSDLDTYCWFDDSTFANETVIGVHVDQTTYAYSNPIYGDFIIYDLVFTNTSTNSFLNSFIGFHMDADISALGGGIGEQAHYRDDMVGYNSQTHISYIFDGDNPTIDGDDTGGENDIEIGYFGQMALHADENKYAQEDIPFSHSWWDWNNDPEADIEYYTHLSGGIINPPPSPHDFRYLQSFGPYDILAGESVNITIAIGVGEGFTGLEYAMTRAMEIYENDFIETENPVPLPPTDVSTVNMYPAPILMWDPSPDPGIDHYNIYVNETFLESVDASVTSYDLSGSLKSKNNVISSPIINKNPSISAPGDQYDFQVAAVWGDGTEGALSEPVTVVSGEPTTVIGLYINPQNEQISLNWQANPEGNITGYNIYRDNQLIANTSAITFNDENVSNGIRYGYQITAVNTNALESVKTQEVYAIPNSRLVNKVLLVDHSGDMEGYVKYFYQRYVVYGYDYDYWNLLTQGSIPSENLNEYSSIIWLMNTNSGEPWDLYWLTNGGGTEALRTFLDSGGNLWLSGSYILDQFYYNFKPLPGYFEYDYMKLLNWDGAYYTDLSGTDENFPDLTIDVGKDPDQNKDAYILNDPDSLLDYQTDAMYSFGPRSPTQFHDKTCAVYYEGEVYNTAMTGFPLYYMPGDGIMQMSQFLLTDIFAESYISNPPPITPINLELLDWTETTIDIRWQRGNEEDLFRYNVYRSTSAGGTYIKDNSQIISESESEYTLLELTPGTEYFIKVSVIDLTQQESELSDYVHEIAGRPKKVQNLGWDGIDELGIATIAWDASEEEDVIQYNIYIDGSQFASTSQTEYQINVKDILVKVYVTAEDNLNVESYPSNEITVSNIAATEDLLIVNGISYSTYGSQMTDFYTAAACIGSHTAHVWDLFGNQGVDYTSLNSKFEEQYLEYGAIPDTFLFKYHKVIWIGNNYRGDLDFFSQQQVMDYLQQGGNFLLATRFGSNFLSGDLQEKLGILYFYTGRIIDATYPLIAEDANLEDMGPGNGATSSTGTDYVRLDPADNLSVLFNWNGDGTPRVAGFRKLLYRQGEFIYLAGRPYRLDLTASYNNYDYIIDNWLNGQVMGIKKSDSENIPTEFTLSQNYPNPFNPETIVSFGLPKRSEIQLMFYNLLGQKIRIFKKVYDAGYHQIVWDGSNQVGNQVATGLYIYRFEADDFRDVKKCLLLK